MTLPQEIKDKVSADAQASANIQYFNYPADVWSNTEVAEREHIAGYELGATEWAGKAQVLVDALEAFILWQGPTLKNWPVMERAQEALAKYKEVTNG